VPAYGADYEPSIKKKFSVNENITGKAGVDAAFKELSAFIKKDGLAKYSKVINLGDWIELEGGLTVAAYGDGGGGFKSSDDTAWDTEITWGSDSCGKMNRLVVVGINSFDGNGNPPHVVFQFQNIPVTRRMNKDASNTGGYPASEMRKYLTPVTGVAGSGNFLAGLKNAGVPEAVLWGPVRVMATKDTASTATIHDLLWLPTAWEMFGAGTGADSSEAVGNQVRLAYYMVTENLAKIAKTIKGYPTVNQALKYWLASAAANNGTHFCMTLQTSSAADSAETELGVAPAFCVQ
jgi:hypothetical protein